MRRILGTIFTVSVLALVLPDPPPAFSAEEPPTLTCGDWLNWEETHRMAYMLGLVHGLRFSLAEKAGKAQTQEEKAAWTWVALTLIPINVQATLMVKCARGPGESLSIQAFLAFYTVAEEKKSQYLAGKEK